MHIHLYIRELNSRCLNLGIDMCKGDKFSSLLFYMTRDISFWRRSIRFILKICTSYWIKIRIKI